MTDDFMSGVVVDGEEVYSPSKLTLFQNCPAKYFFKYIRGMSSPASVNMVTGSGIHKVYEMAYRTWLLTGKYPSLEELHLILTEYWVQHLTEFPKEDLDHAIDVSKNLLSATYDNLLATRPKHTEYLKQMEVPGKDYSLMGYVDMIDEDETIIDYKTSAKSPYKNEDGKYVIQPNHEFQLQMYAFLYTEGKAEKVRTRIDYLVLTKDPHIVQVERVFTRNDIERAMERTDKTVRSIRAFTEQNLWFPNYTYSLCNHKYCPFWDPCHETF